MPAPKGPGVDQSVVERVKALRAMGTSQVTIAKQLDISVQTVRRYERRPDDSPEQEEARTQELIRFVETGWKIEHLAMATVLEGLEKGEIKPKDAAVIMGIMADKILAVESRLGKSTGSDTETITFKFVSDGTENRPLPDTGEIPHLESPIQSDDLRPGGGEDVLRLPGGRENGSGVPQIVGSDSSFNVSES